MLTKIITAPSEIIALAEAAAFLRVDAPSEEATEIGNMIVAARQWVEDYLERAIGVQTLEAVGQEFPIFGSQAILLRPPVVSVTSVIYTDPNNDSQTLVANTDYYVSLDSEPGEIIPVSGWPVAMNKANSLIVRYVAGYSDPGDSPLLSLALPRPIRLAMLMQIADLYQNRESQSEKPLAANQTLERMLSMYRLGMGI